MPDNNAFSDCPILDYGRPLFGHVGDFNAQVIDKTPWGDYAFMPHIVSNRGPLASRHIESLPDFYLDSSYGIAFDPTGDKVEVHGINGENNTSVEEIVDYLFTLVGDWN